MFAGADIKHVNKSVTNRNHRRTFSVSLSNRGDGIALEQARNRLVHVKFEPCLRAVRRIRGYGNTKCLNEIQQRLLDEIWMMLNLEDGGFDASITLEIKEQGTAIVTVRKDLPQPYVGTVRSK